MYVCICEHDLCVWCTCICTCLVMWADARGGCWVSCCVTLFLIPLRLGLPLIIELETGSPTDHWAWDWVSNWSLSLRQGLPRSWSCDGSQQALVILQPPYVIVLELQVCVHQCPAFYLDASVWTCLHVSSASMLAHTHWIISPTPRIESFMKNVFAKWIYKF